MAVGTDEQERETDPMEATTRFAPDVVACGLRFVAAAEVARWAMLCQETFLESAMRSLNSTNPQYARDAFDTRERERRNGT